MTTAMRDTSDTAALRKARGAFFTPPGIASHIAGWAVRHAEDRVLEPSTGDAEFLVHVVKRLRQRGAENPPVWGCELHAWSARQAERRIAAAGASAEIRVGDFFEQEPKVLFDAVVGNPPYIRFQDFAGEQRAHARAAALRGGVALSGMASSWAAFTVHSALHLNHGGRLGFVLPAEILTANYAAPVRRFLMESFAQIDLTMFDERVFPEAETEVVLLLADGYRSGASRHITVRQVRNADALDSVSRKTRWSPRSLDDRWSGSTVAPTTREAVENLSATGAFTTLGAWGHTRLGMVTGRNTYFALTPSDAEHLELAPDETLPLSPPGSRHLRGLDLTEEGLEELGRAGKRTRLFYPPLSTPSPGARAYIARGEAEGIDQAYKCRTRRTWWQVPLMPPADLLLTCMNADTVRLVTNSSGALHLNSVHGVYLDERHRERGRELLPLAALNSVTMLSAELTGRSYGGGILKMEPGEAARWEVPSPKIVQGAASVLRRLRGPVASLLREGRLLAAVEYVDEALLVNTIGLSAPTLHDIRAAREAMALRRESRGRPPRDHTQQNEDTPVLF